MQGTIGGMSSKPTAKTRPTSDAPVVVVGDAIVTELRETEARGGLTSRSYVGGSALNVAMALARLGVPIALIASIGDDPDGLRIRDHLHRCGIQFAPSVSRAGTGRAVGESADGEPLYTFDDAARARRIRFDDEQVALIRAAPFVAISGFAFDDKKQHRRLLEAVIRPQERLLLDPNPRLGLVEDAGAFLDNFERHVSSALFAHLSDNDADLLFDAPLDEATSDMLDLGATHVLATEGTRGGRWVNRAGIDVAEPIVDLPGDIVDTMGAGDAVFATAVASIAQGGIPHDVADARRILQRAMTVAAATVRVTGSFLAADDDLPPAADA